jgi:DNA-binding response OmpR family regulator
VRLLLVEDDDAIAASVGAALATAGIEVDRVARADDAVRLGVTGVHDVVLLDLGLPDGDGLDVARAIRDAASTPIIIVSARGDEVDRVVGLEIGADDYVVKPFSQRELLARIRAVTRRTGAQGDAAGERRSSRLSMDDKTRTASLDGEVLALTAKEFDLLHFLWSDPGVVFRRNEILDAVWEIDWYGTTKTLDAHVAAIRKKLGDQGWIEAVRGVGFRFVELGR